MYLPQKTESVSDYVVSSYTPTISAPSNISFKMMVVTQPGQTEEIRRIQAHVPDKILVRLAPGSVEKVISHLSTISIAHFACHAQQSAQNPLESGLVLHDGQLKLSRIMQQSIPTASLAFLSSCETAMGDEYLPDRAIHLGSTLLFAGLPWSCRNNVVS
jgi:CHAT domain-containing protein